MQSLLKMVDNAPSVHMSDVPAAATAQELSEEESENGG